MLLGTGCDTFTHWKPDPKTVVGTYVPDGRTEEIIRPGRSAGASRSQIVIRSDGSFAVENVPKWNNARELSEVGELVTRTGTWQLEKNQGMWVLRIEYSEDGKRHFESIQLRSQKPPYWLHIGIGDPDSFLGLVFRQEAG